MNSIRRKLTRNLLISTYLLFGCGLLALYFATREELVDGFDAALQTKAVALSTLTRVTPEGGIRVDGAERFARNFEDSRQNDFFEFWNAAGSVALRSEALGSSDLPRSHGKHRHPRYWNLTMPNSRAGRAICVEFMPKEAAESSAPVQLVVAMDREELDETLTLLSAVIGVCGALLVIATLFLIPRVIRHGLLPLKTLSEQAGKIDASSLSTRFKTDDLPEELQPITERLNELLTRLEHSFERERRFSADLAHELRTPLAELRSLAECALKWPESRDASTDKEALAIACQMEAIVTRMLALARGELGQLSINPTSVDLSGFVQKAWIPFSQRAAERELNVTLDLNPARAMADEVLLRSILNNLFDNAVDYSPAGGELGIGLRTTRSETVITVSNRAENLAPEDLERLFDPFWRKETARSGEGSHVGLGLSLARSFSQAMGFKLSAGIDEGKQLVFSLSIPASRSD